MSKLKQMKLNNNSPGPVINYYMRSLGIRQTDLAKHFKVTQPAIAMAINNYKGRYDNKLRQEIINFIKNKKRAAA